MMPDPTSTAQQGSVLKEAVRNHLREMLEGISIGDVVEIHWLDASLSRGVTKITNRTIATYKRTLGRFVGAFKDLRYGHPYIVVQHEVDEGGVNDVSSIPAAVVAGVTKIASKALSLADFMWVSNDPMCTLYHRGREAGHHVKRILE